MGFLTTIPASKLACVYETLNRKLVLYAEGEVVNFTTGIAFHQDTLAGGLKFTLMGWTGPIGEGKRPYKQVQEFGISLPLPHFNDKTVLVVTENHPKGKAVPIRYLGLDKAVDAVDPKVDLAIANSPTTLLPGHVSKVVYLEELFKISANVVSPLVQRGGSVDIKWDESAVILENAGLEGADMVWTFKAAKAGETHIYVDTSGGIEPIELQTAYNVEVIERAK